MLRIILMLALALGQGEPTDHQAEKAAQRKARTPIVETCESGSGCTERWVFRKSTP